MGKETEVVSSREMVVIGKDGEVDEFSGKLCLGPQLPLNAGMENTIQLRFETTFTCGVLCANIDGLLVFGGVKKGIRFSTTRIPLRDNVDPCWASGRLLATMRC
jgi:hypothetical protein